LFSPRFIFEPPSALWVAPPFVQPHVKSWAEAVRVGLTGLFRKTFFFVNSATTRLHNPLKPSLLLSSSRLLLPRVCVCVFLLTFSLQPYRQISKPLSFSLQQVRTTHRRALQSAPLETALWLDCSVIHVFSPFLLDHLFFFCRLFCRVIFLLVFLLALSFFVSYCCVDSLCFALLLGSRSSSLRWALTPILLLCVCVFA
jgi:hypothetical protein